MATISRGYVNLLPPWYNTMTISYLYLSFTNVTFSYAYLKISPGNVLCGTTTSAFHLAMWHAVPLRVYFTWQCAMRYHDQCNLDFNIWPRWKRIKNLHKFRNYESIRQHLCFCVDRKCKIAYFYVTNNSFRLNVTLLFYFVFFLIEIYFCYWIHRHVITCFNLIGSWLVAISNRHTKTSHW
jgi:hypothetical protein